MNREACQYRNVTKHEWQPVVEEPKSCWYNGYLREITTSGHAIVEAMDGSVEALPLTGNEYYQLRMGHRPPDEPHLTYEQAERMFRATEP